MDNAQTSTIHPSDGQDTGKSVCAVLVSYRPMPEVEKNIALLLDQLAHVVVVDNTPQTQQAALLDHLEQMDRCTVIRNCKNLGIATALNIGIRHAIALGFSWIITFDQDSQICGGYVEGMLATYRECSTHSRVGIVFPEYRDACLGHTLPPARSSDGEALVCMTSGALIHAETFIAIGPMEDQLFIDQVDHEYCLRLRSHGMSVIESPRAVLQHSLGHISLHTLLGRPLATANHRAERRYYVTRNRLLLIKRYWRKDREWVKFDSKNMVMETLTLLLFERNRVKKMLYILRGALDAVLNRLGPRVAL